MVEACLRAAVRLVLLVTGVMMAIAFVAPWYHTTLSGPHSVKVAYQCFYTYTETDGVFEVQSWPETDHDDDDDSGGEHMPVRALFAASWAGLLVSAILTALQMALPSCLILASLNVLLGAAVAASFFGLLPTAFASAAGSSCTRGPCVSFHGTAERLCWGPLGGFCCFVMSVGLGFLVLLLVLILRVQERRKAHLPVPQLPNYAYLQTHEGI